MIYDFVISDVKLGILKKFFFFLKLGQGLGPLDWALKGDGWTGADWGVWGLNKNLVY